MVSDMAISRWSKPRCFDVSGSRVMAENSPDVLILLKKSSNDRAEAEATAISSIRAARNAFFIVM